ncbi:spore germination protein GerPC [Bacillus sp. 165]|uniref:spore germination protein GerPC n=1 Tax=Bacillus sp. 165 TaxID=1529117 RepID=UPI001AD966AB|nr:spore gernimation protein GerPC [Bacillus sp. 165]
MNQDLFPYLQQLQAVLQEQQQKIADLEATILQLSEEVEAMRKNPPTSIGKVEYKFDQLKVENLNGTLNIGLNPFTPNPIEDLVIEEEKLKVEPEAQLSPDFYQDIIQEMDRYLNEEAYGRIIQLENEQRTPLDEMYRQMMIDDIKKQMEHRIPYYMSQVEPYPEITSNPKYMKEIIIQTMKQDIDKAFLAFIQHLPHNVRKEW